MNLMSEILRTSITQRNKNLFNNLNQVILSKASSWDLPGNQIRLQHDVIYYQTGKTRFDHISKHREEN